MKVIKLKIVLGAIATEIIQTDNNNVINGTSTFTPSGVDLGEALVEYLKHHHQFFIDRLSAQHAIFLTSRGEQDASIELVGRNLDTGFPQRQEILASKVDEAISKVLDIIISKVVRRISNMVSIASTDITFDNAIILSGEFSRLSGIDKRVEEAIRAEALTEAEVIVQ